MTVPLEASAPRPYVRLDAAGIRTLLGGLPELRARLGGAPAQWRVREVGDGNLNLVFLVTGSAGGLCVKQSLPHIRAIESWRLTVERTFFEQAYFRAVEPHAGRFIPRIHYYEPQLYCIVMEELTPHVVLRGGLIDGWRYPNAARDIAEFVACATFATSDFGQPLEAKMDGIARFAGNHALVRITSDLVFTDPYRLNPLNRWTSPQLDGIAAEFRADAPLRIAAARRGRQFLTCTQALIHGDLHTGSVMVTPADTRVIDPEFAFYGPIGMDLGAFTGNLLMNYLAQPGHATADDSRDEQANWVLAQIPVFWDHFRARFLELWTAQSDGDVYAPSMFTDAPGAAALQTERERFMDELFADMLGFAAVKMIRRILGFAHNADFERIADPDRRAACERSVLDLARTLLVAPERFTSVADVLAAARARISKGHS
jgi:5-methylthioribose kinase